MVKLGAGIENISGKVGGNIFRWDQCRQHVQSTPFHINRPPTLPQRKRRRAFTKLMNYVRRYSTAHFVHCWSHYAHTHKKKNKKGETITLAWYQMFISHNVNRLVADEEIAPLPPGYPSEPP